MKALLTRFRSFCVSSFPLVAFFLVISNFIVSCSVSRAARPQYHYKTFVVTNVVSSVVTNFISSPSFSSSVPSGSNTVSSVSSDPPVYDGRYKYFVLESRRMAFMDGTYYGEGDICSRGLILRIFPDRIFLHNGSCIENKLVFSLDSPSLVSSPPPFQLPKRSK